MCLFKYEICLTFLIENELYATLELGCDGAVHSVNFLYTQTVVRVNNILPILSLAFVCVFD